MIDNLENKLDQTDGVTKTEIETFIKYIETEEYDTDSVEMDIDEVDIGSPNTYHSSNILVNVCTSPASMANKTMKIRAYIHKHIHSACLR